ncbi:MAG: hypothetical protein ACI9MS_003054 [Glaciecola sp.]|jgi:hypothetical protein
MKLGTLGQGLATLSSIVGVESSSSNTLWIFLLSLLSIDTVIKEGCKY